MLGQVGGLSQTGQAGLVALSGGHGPCMVLDACEGGPALCWPVESEPGLSPWETSVPPSPLLLPYPGAVFKNRAPKACFLNLNTDVFLTAETVFYRSHVRNKGTLSVCEMYGLFLLFIFTTHTYTQL